jgi:hypothetical protein
VGAATYTLRRRTALVLATGFSLAGCLDVSRPAGDEALLAPPLRGDVVADDEHGPRVPRGAPFVLRGTVLTPEGIIKHGYVGIAGGRIVAVSDKQPDMPDAVTINTEGIIVPGFVDLHNHVPWNALPRWRSGRTFTNRDQWAAAPEYRQAVAGPFVLASASSICDMNAWGELRALVGGTTSIMATQQLACIHGLVRNLDYNSGFYGTTELDREHIFNVLRLPPANDPVARATFAGAARFFIANASYEGLAMHVAEGTDDAAEEEFAFLRSQSLLNPKGVLIHGISLSPSDFQEMARTGTALVWSPRSNLELYGTTTDIRAALDAGVEITLAPDWAITGSSNMLDELATASRWNREQMGARLTDRQLVEMATSAPAHAAAVDDEVGAIRPGLRADVLVLRGDRNQPYRTVIDARPPDVQVVLIAGVPLYGERRLMSRFWEPVELERLPEPLNAMALATPGAGLVIAQIAARLQAVLGAAGTSLAPLTER